MIALKDALACTSATKFESTMFYSFIISPTIVFSPLKLDSKQMNAQNTRDVSRFIGARC